MKTLSIVLAFFIFNITFGQKTAYNLNTIVNDEQVSGQWYKVEAKTEFLSYKPSVVAYVRILREVKKALIFYGMEFDKRAIDNTVIASFAKIDDAETMDLTIKMEKSAVEITWENEKAVVVMICEKAIYSMLIKEK